MFIERVGLGKLLKKIPVLAFFYTFFVVNIGWVFFRVTSIRQAFCYVKRMLLPWLYKTSSISLLQYIDIKTVIVFIIAVLGFGWIQRIVSKNEKIIISWKCSWIELIFLILIYVLCVMSLAGNTYNPFIYFRF